MLPDASGYLWLFVYLIAIGLAISVIYSIIEWFSKDRVLKQVSGKRCVVFLGSDAYYGKLVIPPRSKGGFEVMLSERQIENPEVLLAFLKENYEEMGDRKFLKGAERLLEKFKQVGILPADLTLDDIEINPWSPPSLVSKKVYASQLGDLHAIMIFRHMLSEKELKKKWAELRRLYTAGFFYRLKRRVQNALAYVKDKLTAAVTAAPLPVVGAATPELKKTVEEAEKKALAGIGKLYEPLLENSIGRLVTVRVQDVEGEVKLYQGVLKEYSDNYLYVLDVDYRLQMDTKFTPKGEAPGYPRARVVLHGFRVDGKHLEGKWRRGKLVLTNVHDDLVKVEKVRAGEAEVAVNRVLKPGESVKVDVPRGEVHVEYEVPCEADVVWPRKRASVVGLGDYPADLLKEVLSGPLF